MKKIVLSKKLEDFDKLDIYDLVVSNINFVNNANQKYLHNDDLHYDSLCSYYIDFYDENVRFNGFKAFFFKSRNRQDIKKYISDGLVKMKLDEHLDLFNEYLKLVEPYDDFDIYDLEGNFNVRFHDLDAKFKEIDTKIIENANALFLRDHPDRIYLDDAQQKEYLEKLISNLDEDDYLNRKKYFIQNKPTYVKDIIFLSQFLNEELLEIEGARFKPFHYEPQLHIYFKTNNNSYSYIDLGYEIVLLDNQHQEIRRFSRNHQQV